MIYIESKVRTNKLYCSDCGDRIKKGDNVIFLLTDEREMEDVYCKSCSKKYENQALEDNVHPFSSEALGQD